MIFKLVGMFRTALARQIMEAVRIRGRGESVLNSKGEYDRCKIHMLTIGKEVLSNIGTRSQEEEDWNIGTDVRVGEDFLLEKRKKRDRVNKVKNVVKPGSVGGQKRGLNDSEGLGRQSKKRKYLLLGENWGQLDGVKKCGLNRKLGNRVYSMGDDEVGTSPLLIDDDVEYEVARPLEGREIVGTEIGDVGLTRGVSENNDMRGDEVSSTGIQDEMTGPLTPD